MQIEINGKLKSVSERLTAQQLLQELGIEDKKLALEINQEIVPRSTFSNRVLQSGDKVEIIHAIGGG
ncbi:MAG: sulfur carrier protein ThiS [Gammaproteobacteria bacterium]